jgi:hypothetical protein
MMLKPFDPPPNDNEPVPPECRATVDLIQRALDGDAGPESLGADTHATACPSCRERVRAARALLSVLAAPREPVAVPADFADRVLTALRADRQAHNRRRIFASVAKVVACAAIAAAVLIGAFVIVNKPQDNPNPAPFVPPVEVAKQPETAPPPREKPPAPAPAPAPEPRPIRVGDELAKAGQALLEAQKPLADSFAVAPKLFEAIPNPFKLPATPQPDPMATALEPARKSLTELPGAAKVGLEPLTGTAEKAFKRFLSDVGAVKPNS